MVSKICRFKPFPKTLQLSMSCAIYHHTLASSAYLIRKKSVPSSLSLSGEADSGARAVGSAVFKWHTLSLKINVLLDPCERPITCVPTQSPCTNHLCVG